MPWLLAARGVRSFSQALLVVAIPLYVAAAGYSPRQIGYLLSMTSVGAIALVLAAGVLSDRYGRKPVLWGITFLSTLGAASYAITTRFWPLAITAALTAVGRGGGAGSGGNWGPFYPAEQPLIAASCADRDRNAAFAAVSFIGVLGSAIGSLVATLPTLLQTRWHVSAVNSFRPLFWMAAAAGLVLLLLILPIHEERVSPEPWYKRLTPTTRGLIGRLWLTNGFNGLAFGVLGPFLTYWFAVRYGVGAAKIGSLYTLINLLTAFSFLASAAVARRLGSVRAVVVTRIGTVTCLAIMAWAPTYTLAAIAYILRMMINSVGMPIRQSFVMGVSERQSRATVAALSNLPSQVTSTVSPTLAAYLLERVSQECPLWFATSIMAINATLYGLVFRHMKPPEERRKS